MKLTTGLILAGVLLFGISLNDPFHFDDSLITNDSNVTNPGRLAHFFNPFYLRQLTFFSFYLNHLVGGLNPSGYHIVNVALHIANAVLLFWLLRRFVDPWIAFAAAAVFLAHPIQTEPVLYVYQRSILLACFFSLIALIALAERRMGWAALAFVLAFESKESAVAVPLAVALLTGFEGLSRPLEVQESNAARSNSTSSRLRWVLLIAGLVFGVATLALLYYVNERTVGVGAAQQIGPVRYFITETRVVFTYLRLLVYPHPQSLEYEFQNEGGAFTVLGVLAILVGAWFGRRHVWGLCVLAFFILLAPTSSIIPSADAAFEHRLYLPMLAFSVLVAYLLSRIPRRTWVAATLLAILAILTVRRERVWATDIALWEDTAKHSPGKARVWFNLGGAYLSSEPDKAHAAFLHALELQPFFPEALYNLGLIEQRKKNWSTALAYYERTLAQDPRYWPACNNMGNTLAAMGEQARALDYFERTLRLNPDYWPAQYNIAILQFTSGRFEKAVPRLRTVLDWQPDFQEARRLLAESLSQLGNRRAAEEEFKKLSGFAGAESRNTPTMIVVPSKP
jgi:protein O-mannosyl-transferase